MLGGAPTGAIGFAMGVERLYNLVKKIEKEKLDYFIVSNDPKHALVLANKLRLEGKSAEIDYQNRKFIKQLEKASKCAHRAIILGEDEIKGNFYSVKDLNSGVQEKIEDFRDLI